MLLPKVNPELLHSSLQSFSHDEELGVRWYKKIKEENPVLWLLVETVLKGDEINDDFRDGYCKAALHFYYLLNAQLECDALSE